MASMIAAGCTSTSSIQNDENSYTGTFTEKSNNYQSRMVLNKCVDELEALKSLSRDDYNVLKNSFKEVNEINQLYKRIASTTSPDTKALLQMSIEAKTTMLCAKVRYSSVLSTESILEQVDVL
ncbi:hypothetical protein [Wohlfahrtiimonas larvae]|nr:hypothetical protein [Wohlfahrtiimonas larvae]